MLVETIENVLKAWIAVWLCGGPILFTLMLLYYNIKQ